MWHVKDEDVEGLLRREARTSLPLARQILLYLDPFALFKDASRGPASVRQRALTYNRTMRWMLLPYLQRWIMIAVPSFVSVAPAKAFAAQFSLHIIPAALGVGCCIAMTVIACTVVVYFYLGMRD